LSWQHFSKHNFPRISTFRGMQTDSNRQWQKQKSSIRSNRDPEPKSILRIFASGNRI
jgi:hypothetical protein